MSLSYSDCYSDLLCAEESDILSGADQSEYTECSYEYEHCPDFDESIAEFIEQERKFVPGIDYVERFQSQVLDASARGESVAWILKVQRFYGFQPLTAYLSVNYLDRFIYCRGFPVANGWPLQLLSVACLSLAAKMEEPLVPSIIDLQVEGAKYIFEPRTIRRMEFLVLSVLDWRLRSITPFSFIGFFAHKIDPTGTYTGFLISRATQIILSNIQEASLLEYWPSCIAAATILCAASDLSNFSLINAEHAESWCDGLSKEKITKCYRLVQGMSPLNRSITKFSKILPVQVRVLTRTSNDSGDSSSSSSSPSSYKRRKLNNSSWVDDDKRSSSS
ncbi:CYCLIN D1,1 [Artemisia annua]|uniref:CYCLIN D1,1 n=1 Tax=Artemisia annua TaxID=35608 RepID=A0A2U1PHT2_ARTAN|nr:CYCLIN D1,1 [Artemisia annua]PWA85313.1 CYCLIN D1,1 [Artemisia annua]